MVIKLNALSDNTSELDEIIFKLTSENKKLIFENQSLLASKLKISSENQSIRTENQKLILLILELKEEIRKLIHKQFGRSSEKINKEELSNIEHQLEDSEISLGLNTEDTPEENNVPEEKEVSQEKSKTKNKAKRKNIPEHIPRKDIKLDAGKNCQACDSGSLRQLGEDISEILEYIPASFIVLRYIRPRYVCKECEAMNQSYPASKGIDKGKAGCGLLAHIMVQKYCNHLPLYRQSEMYARESVEISRSTMSSWMSQCSKLLNPLIDVLRQKIFSASKLHGDDTPVRVLDKGAKKTKQGRIWVYALDGRSCNDKTPPAVCYFYSPDRDGKRPESHLKISKESCKLMPMLVTMVFILLKIILIDPYMKLGVGHM